MWQRADLSRVCHPARQQAPQQRIGGRAGEQPALEKELENLQQRINESLGRVPEKRPLKLHLTIARFRPATFSSFPIKQLDEKVDWRDKINRVVFFEAHLSRDGAQAAVELPHRRAEPAAAGSGGQGGGRRLHP